MINSELITNIVLESSDHAKQFEPGNLVHQVEFEHTIKHIQNALRIALEDPKREHLHNTITILGTRGSGKTSFLLSIKKWIEKNGRDLQNGVDLSPIQVIGIVDPTLIEEKGHVFLNVISLIMDLVEEKLNRQECYPPNEIVSTSKRKEWRGLLNKLAAGLPSIDGIGNYNGDSWQDPEFVMDNGLKAVSASQKLLKNFNDFLDKSLDIIEKKAFLVIFDDIDVDSSKGWVVLETIRKYFTGTKLITLISGDLELYTTVVRQRKWKNFGQEILRYEGAKSGNENGLGEFGALVTTLTAQYMLKIMQPHYRVHLGTLLQRKNTRGRLDLEVRFDEKSKSEDLDKVYEKILNKYGIRNAVQVEIFLTFLLAQPLRSQIQLLLLLQSDATIESYNIIDNSKISDIFLSNLLEQKVDITMAANSPKHLISVILKFLIKERNLEDLYQLQPTTTSDSLNSCLYSLGILVSNTIKNNNRFVIFDYLIKVGYLRNLMTLLPYREDGLLNQELKPSIEGLCDRSGIFNSSILRDITGKIQAYLYSTLDFESSAVDITPYFIQLKALRIVARQPFTDRLDVVFKAGLANRAQRILGYIPAFSLSFSYKNESRIGYSFYLLLSTIGEILKQHETILTNVDEEKKVALVRQLLKELSQLRSYPLVGFMKRQIDTTAGITIEHTDNLEEEENQQDDSENDLAYIILRWIESNAFITAATHLLGRVATRFYYAMSNIAESAAKDLPLGELFHRQVIAFMNAVLIEDVRENLDGASSRLNINNTNTDDLVFVNNLKILVRSQSRENLSDLCFSRWVLSCPLLLVYLKQDETDEIYQLLSQYSGRETIQHETQSLSISNLLNQVLIRSQVEVDDSTPAFSFVQGTPDLLEAPDELARLLAENQIPYEWFVEGNRLEARRHNRLIRRYLSSVFLSDNLTSTRIKEFRSYLANRQITW